MELWSIGVMAHWESVFGISRLVFGSVSFLIRSSWFCAKSSDSF